MTITVPFSGGTFEAELEAEESGVLMLSEPSGARMRAFYPLAAVLKTTGASRARHPRSRRC